jgi:Short C-terminal domain
VLFLYRPPQTWMPYALPRQRTDQAAYNRRLQQQFASTRRVPPPEPAADLADPREQRQELDALRDAGALTEAEYEAAVARIST